MSFLLNYQELGIVALLTAFFGGYLSGSVPYGLVVAQILGVGDLRKSGSGNIGATNALRVGGKKLGIITLVLDMLKGFVPVMIAKSIHMDLAVLCALGAFIGHLFPVWLKFKGGKGVATGIAVLAGLWWQLGLAIVCIWLLTAMISKYSSASALAAFGLAPILAVMLTKNYQVILVSLIVGIMILARHHENLRRLANGTEGKINLGGKKDDAAAKQ